MDLGLKGKCVLITASSQGIGFSTAERFLQEGANVLINGRKEEKLRQSHALLQKTHGSGRVYRFLGDMSKESCILQCRDYIEGIWGRLDVLVPNLGSGKPMSKDKLDIQEWESMIDVNLLSAVRVVRAFADLLPLGGSIVLLSSIAAYGRMSAPYAYAASKNAIRTLNCYLAGDLAKRSIRVNCVIPGNVMFPGGRWEELYRQDKGGVERYIHSDVPLKRFGRPQEIADAIAFLASERAKFITGAELAVDGGQKRC